MATSRSNHELVSLDDDDEVQLNIPNRETCQKLVEEFASVTQTDEALAQCFLQDHEWKLELSLNAFYESKNNSQENNKQSDQELLVTFDSSNVSVLSRVPGNVSLRPPNKFTFITWNLDGLDEHNLKKRTKAVVKIIQEENADIVFLQEVIPVTYTYLEENLPDYMFIPGATENYFVATLLLRTTVYFDGHFIHPFPNSRMGRNLLFVDCHIGSLKLRLLNAHLESTKDFTQERKAQLRSALSLLKSGTTEHTSIFAGDLNLRDKEANEVKIPHDIYDLWESCGRRKECQFTWDTMRNTNKSFPGKFKPRSRFDRVYLKQSDPPSVDPKHFGLVGIQKVAGTQSFPSDHWGIVVHFDIVNQRATTSTPPPSHSLKATESSHNHRNVASHNLKEKILDTFNSSLKVTDPSHSNLKVTEPTHSNLKVNEALPSLSSLKVPETPPSCSREETNRTIDCFDVSGTSIDCLDSPKNPEVICEAESDSRKGKRKFSLVELD